MGVHDERLLHGLQLAEHILETKVANFEPCQNEPEEPDHPISLRDSPPASMNEVFGTDSPFELA
jgi:hypothetical protein